MAKVMIITHRSQASELLEALHDLVDSLLCGHGFLLGSVGWEILRRAGVRDIGLYIVRITQQ